MKISLQICKKELDLIKSGTKKKEFRSPSKFNMKILTIQNLEIKDKYILIGNPEITEIEFLNGYSKVREKLTIKCKGIRLVRFQNNVDEPDNNFKALEGQVAIEILLGEIIK